MTRSTEIETIRLVGNGMVAVFADGHKENPFALLAPTPLESNATPVWMFTDADENGCYD